MNFLEIAKARQSCRNFDPDRTIESEKIKRILGAGILAPSACNSQPYHFTVCEGEAAKKVAKCTTTLGMNKFVQNASALIVISEEPYNKTAAFGAKVKGLDYRSMDIGIATAYLTAEATAQGVESCIIGWLNDEKIREVCSLENPVKLIIALGYAMSDEKLRTKKRKDFNEITTFLK